MIERRVTRSQGYRYNRLSEEYGRISGSPSICTLDVFYFIFKENTLAVINVAEHFANKSNWNPPLEK